MRVPGPDIDSHNIPSDLSALRSAIGAVRKHQDDGVGVCGPGIKLAPTNTAGTRPEGGLNGRNVVQSELARLRFQIDHLREENAVQTAELAAVQGVLAGPGQSLGEAMPEMPLQIRLQAQQAELHDARLRSQQATGVANA